MTSNPILDRLKDQVTLMILYEDDPAERARIVEETQAWFETLHSVDKLYVVFYLNGVITAHNKGIPHEFLN